MYISVIPICGVAFETFKIGSSGTGRNPNLRRFIPLEKDQCWDSALFCVSGPEIVLDCNDYPEALDWLRKLLGCATATGRSKPLLVSVESWWGSAPIASGFGRPRHPHCGSGLVLSYAAVPFPVCSSAWCLVASSVW